MILTSHYLEDIEELCNRIIAISEGKIVYDGSLKLINKDLLNYRYVSFGYDHAETLESVEKYGKIIEKNDAHVRMMVDKKDLKELGKAIFSNDNIFDMTIEEVPLNDIFESLFNK